MVYVNSHGTALLSITDFKYLIYSQSNLAQEEIRGEAGVSFESLDISSRKENDFMSSIDNSDV